MSRRAKNRELDEQITAREREAYADDDLDRIDADDHLVHGDEERQRDKGRSTSSGKRFKLTRLNAVLLDTSAAYLVSGLIPSGGLTVIWGPPKCGKSFFAFYLMMHITRGITYRGRRVQQGPGVYLALEGRRGFHARIEAYRREHNITDAPFYLITERTDLIRDHQALIAAIAEQIEEIAPVVVCIDTLNRSLTGSESKDEDMAAYLAAADAIHEAFKCAVIVVHHCGVDGTRPRGHTSLTGAADAQIAVARDEANNVTATVEWMKDGTEGDVITSRLETVNVGTDDSGQPITSCTLVPVEGEPGAATSTKKRKPEPKSLRLFRAAFTEALDTMGQIIAVRGDGPRVRAVNISDVKTQFDLRYATGEGDLKKRTDAQRKAFTRIMGSLPDRYATWVQGDVEWVWIIETRERDAP